MSASLPLLPQVRRHGVEPALDPQWFNLPNVNKAAPCTVDCRAQRAGGGAYRRVAVVPPLPKSLKQLHVLYSMKDGA